MFKIIEFIPQTSQGLFSHEDKTFAINPPFKKFSIISVQESEINDSLPFVKEHAFFEELENVFQHFENMHLLEMLNNEKLISTFKNQIDAIEKKYVVESEEKIESQELIFNVEITLSSHDNSLLKEQISKLKEIFTISKISKRVRKFEAAEAKNKNGRLEKQSKVTPKTVRKANE